MLARHLVLGTAAPIELKVRLVCEAGQAVGWGDTKADARLAELFRTVGAQALAVQAAYKWFDEEREVWAVRWLPALIRDDAAYADWFEGWDGRGEFQSYLEVELRDKLIFGGPGSRASNETLMDRLDRLPARERFIVRTRALTPVGLGALRSSFYQWAQDLVMKAFAEISKRVDPTVFERVLRSSRTGLGPEAVA
jgi:hypothetical protein